MSIFEAVGLVLRAYYAPFLFGLVASALGAYPVFRMLLALKSRQTVSQYAPEGHQKKQGTPTMGGLIIAVGFLAYPAWNLLTINSQFSKALNRNFTIFALFLSFALIGFIDDYLVPRLIKGKRGLGWKQKILMQLVAAGLCAFNFYGSVSVEMLVMVFLILFFSNAYNFADGLDWLAGSLLVFLSLGLMALAMVTYRAGLLPYLMALLGSTLPFMVLNKPKAKVFMGDVGSLPIGAFLGLCVSAIALPQVGNIAFEGSHPLPGYLFEWSPMILRTDGAWPFVFGSLLVISGMMIVELVPVPLQIASVKLRKKKLFSFTPIHHAFERKGWPEGKVVAVFAACQAAFSLVALLIAYFGCAHQLKSLQGRFHGLYDKHVFLQPESPRFPYGVDQGLTRVVARPQGKESLR